MHSFLVKFALGFTLFYSSSLLAGQALIEKVEYECNYKRLCKFDITISHADEGWTHFANGWQMFSPTGELIKHHAFAHPHVKEQPFSRSVRKVLIPANVDTVIFKANDSIHGLSDRKYVIKLKFLDY